MDLVCNPAKHAQCDGGLVYPGPESLGTYQQQCSGQSGISENPGGKSKTGGNQSGIEGRNPHDGADCIR